MRILTLLLLSLFGIMSCEDPASLEAVSGIEGQILFEGSKPDSIKAVALVVLYPEALSDMANIGSYLVDYSDPLTQEGPYFIQLKPGGYVGVLVGLLVDPGLFAVNVDSYIESGNLPLVQLSQGANAFLIKEQEMLYRDWSLEFSP